MWILMNNIFAAAFVTIGLIASSASAATVASFSRTNNDGVFSITASQAAQLGVDGATKVGLFRVRAGNGVSWNAGDDFNAQTVLNTRIGGSGTIFGVLNGPVDQNFDGEVDPNGLFLTYDGGLFETLGTTIFTNDSATTGSIFRAVAIAFDGALTFAGSSQFDEVNCGALVLPEPVPLPAAAWLLLAGVGGLAVAGRKRRESA
jgi:hypothetical protein